MLKKVLPILMSPSAASWAGEVMLGFSAQVYLPTEAVTVQRRDVTKRKLSE
jgi:hypothetical protein